MWGNSFSNPSARLSFWVGIIGVGVGIVAGILAGTHPSYLCLGLVAAAIAVYFFTNFEQAVLGLLILRSSLDIFSAQQVPAAFAVGLDALTLLYVSLMLLMGQKVQTDRFWWFFTGWVGLQGLWVILVPLGGLGHDASCAICLSYGIREWVRLFSWLMVYLLIMQLKGRVPATKVVSILFLSLALPLSAAFLQSVLPPSLIPSFLAPRGVAWTDIEGASRINGTLGHPNVFATFLIFFLGLTYWKLEHSHRRWPWLILLSTLVGLIVSTKALVGLAMTATLLLALVVPRITLLRLTGSILLIVAIIIVFASTEFGRERLALVGSIPILNPDIDVSRAILLRQSTTNSFYWRLELWTQLLEAWHHSPILGYGLNTSRFANPVGATPHNDYLRALVDTGVVGLVSFLGFLGGCLFRLIKLSISVPKRSSQEKLCIVLIAILISMTVGMFTDNVWSHTTLFFYWWTLLAVVGWNWDSPSNNSDLDF